MPSRERRLLDKEIEIRKLKGELKHYKTATLTTATENYILKKQLKIAKQALNAIVVPTTPSDYGLRGYTACKIIAESALIALEQKDEHDNKN